MPLVSSDFGVSQKVRVRDVVVVVLKGCDDNRDRVVVEASEGVPVPDVFMP